MYVCKYLPNIRVNSKIEHRHTPTSSLYHRSLTVSYIGKSFYNTTLKATKLYLPMYNKYTHI